MKFNNHKIYFGILGLYILIISGTFIIGSFVNQDEGNFRHHINYGRKILEISNCSPRSVEEFPNDFMTRSEREHGGVIFHIVVSIYLFMALAIICDDYFVSSLEKICEVFNLKHDVAGATFMAAGNSAPELFTSIIGVFITNSDVGLSTIVGSAVFNILCVVAVSGIFAGRVIHLTWWPLIRDCVIYSISVIGLIIVIHDDFVYWYEALSLFLIYIIYIIILYFNEYLQTFFVNLLPFKKTDSNIKYSVVMPSLSSSHETLLRNNEEEEEEEEKEEETVLVKSKSFETSYSRIRLIKSMSLVEEDVEHSVFDIPDSFIYRVYWVTMLPMKVLFFFTIPDCRKKGCWRKLFLLTFLVSIVWIGFMTYIIVWMVSITGDTFGIPDAIMGVTFLAAGISVPDAVSSALVARVGYGDMAISNGVGSNIIDILVCLAIPWFIKTGILNPGSAVQITSKGLTYTVITLLTTVVILVVTIIINRWRLNKKLGFTFLFIYICVLIFSCLYELGIFGNITLQPCARIRL